MKLKSALACYVFLCAVVQAAEPSGQAAETSGQAAASSKPIRALLITGGCCHDYTRQKLILTKGISARANVVWTVVQQGGKTTDTKIPVYQDPNWADGFDVVVHNECFAAVRDIEWVERVLKPHREGVPAVLIHCAMHCYRTGTDKWFEFVGMQSPGHGPNYSYTVDNVNPDHPVLQGFGDRWLAPKGELYHSVKLFPTATALASARRRSDNEPQICVWTNQYEKARVFATTIGHYNETMVEPGYLDLVTRGLLWSVDRLDAFHKTDEATDEQIRKLAVAPVAESGTATATQVKCCGAGNLAFGKPVKASTEEKGKKNFAGKAVDGDLSSRWCAQGAQAGESWQVDLEQPSPVKGLRIHWEMANAAYRYKIDSSLDGKDWQTVVDQSQNKKAGRITAHKVEIAEARHLRVTFLGSSTGSWGSFWEFEAYPDDLPELPKEIASPSPPASSIADVKAPAGFEVTMFGQPPLVNYPVCLTAAATGEVFVGVDEQGSLGKESGRGKVIRCIDTDGDGQADQINEFAKMDHPRGLVYDNGSLWVLHPPHLTVYHDDDLDGVADREQRLITGISTDYVDKRGADHTTNGIRMGIDGWIYIAVGDFGFVEAKGADGTKLNGRGGGIVRIRPDGSEMEKFSWGQRNILDVCIDPYMNVFTRDNTNDGGGWDIRLSHVVQSADYGYPSWYLNFSDEIMPPLADYGGGSGCGGMFLHDLRWPEPFANSVLTCDWGRSEVYRHNLPANGPTFDAHQEVFLKIPRPTDIDVDGSGLMYVSSWKNGKFAFSGPNVGFVAQVRPRDFLPKPFPDLAAVDNNALVALLRSASAVHRLHSQREILRRGNDSAQKPLVDLAADAKAPLYGRVAAIFTLKQLAGPASHAELLKLASDDAVREFALRALTDRRSQLTDVPVEPLVKALQDENPRVRAQALISLGRLRGTHNSPVGDTSVAEAVLPLTRYPADAVAHNQPNPARVIPHLAVRSLVAMNAVDGCLKGIEGPDAMGALWALRYLHSPEAVTGLIGRLSRTRDAAVRREVLTTLIRLYHREGEYKGGWWGTRPDRSGPYFDRQKWAHSDRIGDVIKTVVASADKATLEHIRVQLERHRVSIDGLPKTNAVATTAVPEMPIELPKVNKNDPSLIANRPFEQVLAKAAETAGDAAKGFALFKQQSCIKCHTYANGQQPKGPHLVDIGKRYKRTELIESILKPADKIAQGFDTYSFITDEGKVVTGFVVSESAKLIEVRQVNGISAHIAQDEIELRKKQTQSMMPQGLVNNLTPEQLADLLAWLESLK